LDDTDESPSDTDKKDADAKQRRRNNMMRAVEVVNREVSNYEVFDVSKDDANGRQDSHVLNARESSRGKARRSSFGDIKGIPKAAGIGKEGHIY
jgi:hypothetical protein